MATTKLARMVLDGAKNILGLSDGKGGTLPLGTANAVTKTVVNGKDVYKDKDGVVLNLVESAVNPVTGGIKVSLAGKDVSADLGANPQSTLLSKSSKLQLDFTDPTIVWAYTAATSALDKAYQRYSNYTLRVDMAANSAQIRKGTNIAVTCDPDDQLLSIDIYIPFMPISGGSGHSINVMLTNATGYSANNNTYSFDSAYLRQGWNSLRMWGGDNVGGTGVGTLASGASKSVGGTGCDMLSTIGYVEITFNNMTGKSVYLDGVRRAAKVSPILVMGFDATGVNNNDAVMVSKVAPLFAQYGYSSYFTVTNIYDMLYAGSADDIRKRSLYKDFGWDALIHTWNHGATVPGGLAAVTATLASDVVTVTKTAHGYPIGSKLHAAMSGATPALVNGVFEMTATTVNAITYTATGAGTASVTGTLQLSTMLSDVVNATGTLSTQIVQHEVADMVSVMRGCGFNRGSTIGAWPNNSCPELVTLKGVADPIGVRLFRGIKGGSVKVNEFGIDNPLHFGSVEMGSGATATTLQQVKDKLTGVIGRGEHMWTYGHYVQDDTDPTKSAYFPVDNNYSPGINGNPAAEFSNAQGGGYWYLTQISRFLAEAVSPAVAQGKLRVMRPTDFSLAIGVSV